MTPELKARWVAALRSGDYKQGYQALKNDQGCYCCLGVLADVINPKGWHFGNWIENDEAEYDDNKASGTPLPEHILSGIDQAVFVKMNDDQNSTFEQIAAYAERANIEAGGEREQL